MRELRALAALLAVFAIGLVAVGCGDDEESSDTGTAVETTTEDTATAEDATTEETTTEDSGGSDVAEASTPDDVYEACIDVIEGTPAEQAGQSACEQARTAFEQCTQQAEASGDSSAAELAIKACQDAADQTVNALEASGG